VSDIPLWFKWVYTAAVVAMMAIYWVRYGPRNFLWLSDIAWIGAVPALWLESAWLASTLTVLVLLPELLWNVDYLLRLVLRRRITGLTDYMFDASIPLWLRGVSLFHVPLPVVLLWMVVAWGYDRRALAGAVVIALVTLPASYLLGSSEKNLNWVYGLGGRRQARFPPLVYLALLTAAFLLLVFLPTHWLLQWVFG
jgi:hypothetical protein